MIKYPAQFLEFFTRDLNMLKNELNAYTDEANIWKIDGKVSNSAGNLTLHLIGNLNHFFGTTLGHTDYIRQRDHEFSDKNVPLTTMLSEIDKTIAMMETTLSKLDNESLEQTFPVMKQDKHETTGHFMIHLYGHFAYHLGQINYHRRLLDI